MNNQEFLADQLLRARAFHSFASPIFSTEEIEEASCRMALYCGVCENVLEHYGAILTLLENGERFVSAFALLRPLMDATLQSLWLRWCARKTDLEPSSSSWLVLPSGAECAAAIKEVLGVKYPGPFGLLGTELRGLSGVIHPEVERQQRLFNARLLSGRLCDQGPMQIFIQQASELVAIAAIVMVNWGADGDVRLPGPDAVWVATKYLELFGEDL
jgi:hypothetical protein